MAHHVYTTEAFVLESDLGREADRRYTLFTKELGMIRASAQGVRLQKSKLRFSLQDFSLITISIVRGKEWWKIVNAIPHSNIYADFKDQKYVVHTFARLFRLLNRLVPEEGKHESLFEELSAAITFVTECVLDKQQLVPFEYVIALRILDCLGYVGSIPQFQELISEPLSLKLIEVSQQHSKSLISIINNSIRESQL